MTTNIPELDGIAGRLQTQLLTIMDLVERQMEILKMQQEMLMKDPEKEADSHDVGWTLSSLCQSQTHMIEALQEVSGNRRPQI